jgi:hypothetical protein
VAVPRPGRLPLSVGGEGGLTPLITKVFDIFRKFPPLISSFAVRGCSCIGEAKGVLARVQRR